MSIGIVIILWSLSFLLLFLGEQERGTFGDMFGMANALFTGLAFAGVIYTLSQQNTLIDQQKRSVEIQKDELEETRKEFQRQTKIYKQDAFERLFFNMLKMHYDILERVMDNGSSVISNYRKMCSEYNNKTQGRVFYPSMEVDLEWYRKEFKMIMNGYRSTYGVGSRSLLNILELIDGAGFGPDEVKRYIGILFNYLPSEEVLSFYIWTQLKEDRLAALLNKYEIFKEMPSEVVERYHLS